METPIKSLSLAIDMGNSSAKAAVFRGAQMMGSPVRFSYADWRVAERLVTNHDVKNIVYSSVANEPPREVMDNWTKAGISTIALQPGAPLPFPTSYTTPETLGQDRIAAIMACRVGLSTDFTTRPTAGLAVGQPAATPRPLLIVDAGTCVTTDLLDASGRHHGGNISPGIRMRLRSMHEFTARLPLPEPGSPEGALGNSTEEALRHGAQLGLVYELEGLYGRLLPDYPNLHLALTGGDAEWLATNLSAPCSFRPNLVLRGLIQIMSLYV